VADMTQPLSNSNLDESRPMKGPKQDRTLDVPDVPVLRRAAMDFLARREHSSFELKQKLLIKFPDLVIADLDKALSQLQIENLQSDERFTESYVRYRKSRGFAYRRIRADLSSRRVHPDIVSKYLFSDDAEWQDMACELVAKKTRDVAEIEFGSKQHRKLVRFLESRGFLQLEIQKAIDRNLSFISIGKKLNQ
jgi:regulatory protein